MDGEVFVYRVAYVAKARPGPAVMRVLDGFVEFDGDGAGVLPVWDATPVEVVEVEVFEDAELDGVALVGNVVPRDGFFGDGSRDVVTEVISFEGGDRELTTEGCVE